MHRLKYSVPSWPNPLGHLDIGQVLHLMVKPGGVIKLDY